MPMEAKRGQNGASIQREFFPFVRRRVVPRPRTPAARDVLGIAGTVRAAEATIYGSNWYHDPYHDLVEVWDAGPALCFKHLLPDKAKYERENLYLQTSIAYRTTENANLNLRTFSGHHVTLENAVHGAIYEDPNAAEWVTDDLTLNVNSIYRDERVWFQRVDWEWRSREAIYQDELSDADPLHRRTEEEVAALYAERELSEELLRDYVIERLRTDRAFLSRCLVALCAERLERSSSSLVELFRRLQERDAENLPGQPRTVVALRA